MNGSNDIMMPTVNSYAMFKHVPNAQLSLYPDSGHGSIFQYNDLFVSQVNKFLE
ncbi:alpha/beta fold hydrolase [Pseudomonas gingeri]|uniref:alpha/beta fold hydrolase n=1 Tax=Pseudomonas gingeri TaxID=117681 RepID=UPI0034E93990